MQLLNLFTFIFCSLTFNVCSLHSSGKVKKLSCEEFPYKVMILKWWYCLILKQVHKPLLFLSKYFHFFLFCMWNLDSGIWIEDILLEYLKRSSNFGFHYRNISQILGIIFLFQILPNSCEQLHKIGKHNI